jgi:hypothetical protein
MIKSDAPRYGWVTWRADDTCTFKILKTNGTFMLDAAVEYWSKKNGVRGQH